MMLNLIVGKHLNMCGMTYVCESIFAIVNCMESNMDQGFPIKI